MSEGIPKLTENLYTLTNDAAYSTRKFLKCTGILTSHHHNVSTQAVKKKKARGKNVNISVDSFPFFLLFSFLANMVI